MTAPDIDEALALVTGFLDPNGGTETWRWTEKDRENLCRSFLALHASRDAEAKVVAWAERWRAETCSRMPDCNAHDGSHDNYCEIMRNEREGVELVDDLIRLRAGKEKQDAE